MAASDVFAEHGLDASLDQIARRAGLGNATLYRHFATRCALVAAVYAEALTDVISATRRALAEPDAWIAFTSHLRYLCAVQAGNRALADLLTSTLGNTATLEVLRSQAHQGLLQLIDHAKAAGRLRPDFDHPDVVLILMANAGLLERTAAAAPIAWQRHFSYVLDGLRAEAATPAAPGPDQHEILGAMNQLGSNHGFA